MTCGGAMPSEFIVVLPHLRKSWSVHPVTPARLSRLRLARAHPVKPFAPIPNTHARTPSHSRRPRPRLPGVPSARPPGGARFAQPRPPPAGPPPPFGGGPPGLLSPGLEGGTRGPGRVSDPFFPRPGETSTPPAGNLTSSHRKPP